MFVGTNFDYTLSITNFGPSSSGGFSVTDNLPAGLIFVSSTPAASTNGSQVVWSLGSLVAGATTNLTLTVNATLRSALTNLASVGGSAFDTDLTNNISPPTVTSVTNRPPTSADDSYGLNKNSSLTVNAPGVLSNDPDPDGDTLTAVLVATAAHGSLTLNANGSFTYTPVSNYFGADSFTYRANDGVANSGIATVSLTITNVNRAPVATDDSYTLGKNGSLSVTAPGVLSNDTDLDADALTAAVVATAAHGSLTLNANGSFTYTPVSNYFGADSFTYRANDGVANSSIATVSLSITNVNRAPVAVDDNTYGLYKNSSLTVSAPGVLGNDTDLDGDALTAILVATAAHGSVTLNANGSFTYSPVSNYFGADSFTYRASDGVANSGIATVTLTVTNFLVGPQFGILQGTNVFNPQTGLFEQNVTVTNTGDATAAAVRLLVGGLRTNVDLYNAGGTNAGRPYVQYNSPLDPNQTVQFVLEFYDGDRRSFTNSLEAQAVLPDSSGTNGGTGMAISRAFIDSRIVGSPRFVIEFASIP